MRDNFPLLDTNGIILYQERPDNESTVFGITVTTPDGEKGFLLGSIAPDAERGEKVFNLWTRGFAGIPMMQRSLEEWCMPMHRSGSTEDDVASNRLLKRGVTWDNLFIAAATEKRWSDIMYNTTTQVMTSMQGCVFSSPGAEGAKVLETLLDADEAFLSEHREDIIDYIDGRTISEEEGFDRKRDAFKSRILDSVESSSRAILQSQMRIA